VRRGGGEPDREEEEGREEGDEEEGREAGQAEVAPWTSGLHTKGGEISMAKKKATKKKKK